MKFIEIYTFDYNCLGKLYCLLIQSDIEVNLAVLLNEVNLAVYLNEVNLAVLLRPNYKTVILY